MSSNRLQRILNPAVYAPNILCRLSKFCHITYKYIDEHVEHYIHNLSIEFTRRVLNPPFEHAFFPLTRRTDNHSTH